jgi:hypothetical protein
MGFVSFSEDVQEQLDANRHLRPERPPSDVTVRLPQASVILIRCKAVAVSLRSGCSSNIS